MFEFRDRNSYVAEQGVQESRTERRKREVTRLALISFDLDGVLQRNPFQSGRPDGVFGHVKRELAPHTGHADPEAAAAAALDMVMDEHLSRLNSGLLVEAHDWDGIVDTVARRLGYPGKLDMGALVTTYATRPELCYLYPGARECLESLTRAGHTLVSITNGFRAYQEPVLRQLGILPFFKALITPEAVGAAKPQPAIFRAAEAYGSNCIHIGDVLPHDIAGAKRAGWKAILICQMGAPGATELPPELAALPPSARPAAGMDWLQFRLERDRRWHGHPPAELSECIPDAIVSSLHEVPAAVAQIDQ